MANYILQYYQKITDGSIIAGQWIHRLYKYIVTGLENKEFVLDQKKANNAIDWIESHCFHVEGELAPNPLKLELWQKAMLSCMFGICDPETNRRRFREVVLIIARKNGKSLLASAIANYVFQVDGGFGGRVYNIAPKLEQADIVYSNAWAMMQLDPEYIRRKEAIQAKRNATHEKVTDDADLPKKRVSDIYIPATNSTMKKIASSAKKNDGFNPSLCICDEIASWEGDKGLKTYEVMKSGMGARPEGMLLSCSTAGYVSDSIYDEIMKRATRFLMGDSKEKRLLPFLYIADNIEKWNDIDELHKSNPNLGVSVSVDYLLEEIAIAENSLSKKAEFITKYNCLKQNSSLAWLSSQDVEKAYGDEFTLEDFRDCYCVGGIDLSQTTDLTACCVVIQKGGVDYVFCHFFLPSEKIDEATQRDGLPYRIYIQQGYMSESGDNFVDYHDCYKWFTDLVEQYQIYPLQIGYDRYSAQYLVQDMQQYGFHMDDVYQGENLTPVIQEFEGKLKDGNVRIGTNNLLKAHLLDSAVKLNAETNRRKLIKLSPHAHIDGTACVLDAFCVAQKWHSDIGEQLKNEE